jgi:hypothetical protein
MTNQREELKKELQRIRRVSDMLTSMHSVLRDEYARKSIAVDCALFASSIILAALVFMDPVLLGWLPLSAFGSRILMGTFALITFFLSLVVFRVDWKSKSDLHKRAAEAYSRIKLECQELLMTFDTASDTEIQKLLVRYRDLGEICIAVPEGSFLRLKNKHKLKVALSKYLDDNPGACLLLLKLKIWFVNTFKPSSPNLLKKYLKSTTNTDEEL